MNSQFLFMNDNQTAHSATRQDNWYQYLYQLAVIVDATVLINKIIKIHSSSKRLNNFRLKRKKSVKFL